MTIPTYIWGFVSLGIAVLYFFVWPKPRADSPISRPGWRQFILRWFHCLVWVVLAAAFFMYAGWLPGSGLAGVVALVALGLYLTFMVTFLMDKRASK